MTERVNCCDCGRGVNELKRGLCPKCYAHNARICERVETNHARRNCASCAPVALGDGCVGAYEGLAVEYAAVPTGLLEEVDRLAASQIVDCDERTLTARLSRRDQAPPDWFSRWLWFHFGVLREARA